jgi:hypothetical protein
MQEPELVKAIRSCLRKVKDVPRLMQRLRATQAAPNANDFSLLLDSVSNLVLLRCVRHPFLSLRSGAEVSSQLGACSCPINSFSCINAIQSVLFGMQNRAFGPYLVAIRRILTPELYTVPCAAGMAGQLASC